MIKKFSDYDSIPIYESGPSVEPGGYELVILGAKVEDYCSCSILKIMFDIINHDLYNKIFSERYKVAKAQNHDAKWPAAGTFNVFIPKDDGSEMDGYTKQAFKRFITSVENSNSGYIWNWDENSLKGKHFGGVFGREEFKTKNDEYKFSVKCRFPRSIESIKKGDFKIPEDKLLKERNTIQNGVSGAMAFGDVELPSIGDLSNYEEILSDGDVPF